MSQTMGFQSRRPILAPFLLSTLAMYLLPLKRKSYNQLRLWKSAPGRERNWGLRRGRREGKWEPSSLQPLTYAFSVEKQNQMHPPTQRLVSFWKLDWWSRIKIHILLINITLTLYLANKYPSLMRLRKHSPFYLDHIMEHPTWTRQWVTQGLNILPKGGGRGSKGRSWGRISVLSFII